MFARSILATLAAGLVSGCADLPRDVDQPTGSSCAESAPTLHDADLSRRLSEALARLTESGEATRLGELDAAPHHAAVPALQAVAETGPHLSPAAVQDGAHRSVVVVGKRYLCDKCDRWHLSTASGFVATEDGAVCTSFHVLSGRDDTTLAVMTFDGAVLPVVAILAADDASDVALLRVAGATPPPLPLREGIRPGEAVHVLSHPDGAFYYFTSGVVARRFPFRAAGGRTVDQLDVTADFARGSSGAPVLDDTCAVVGVVRATDSVYYTESDGQQRDLQMVFKRATPIDAVLDLIQ